MSGADMDYAITGAAQPSAYKFDEQSIKARLVEKGIDEDVAAAVVTNLVREKFVTMETLSSLTDGELEEFGLKTRGERRMFRLAFGLFASPSGELSLSQPLLLGAPTLQALQLKPTAGDYAEPKPRKRSREAKLESSAGELGTDLTADLGASELMDVGVDGGSPKEPKQKRNKPIATPEEIKVAEQNADMLVQSVPFMVYWKRRKEPELAAMVIRIEKDPDGRQGGQWAPVLKLNGVEGKPRGVAVQLHKLAKSKGYTSAATSADGYKDLYYKDTSQRWHPLRDVSGPKHRNGRGLIEEPDLPFKEPVM